MALKGSTIISQFYGIEINDFAVTVAKTALWIAESQALQETENISPYLVAAPTVFLSARSKPLSPVPNMLNGDKPAEGGNLILTVDERDALLKGEPAAEKFLRPFMMGKDFIDSQAPLLPLARGRKSRRTQKMSANSKACRCREGISSCQQKVGHTEKSGYAYPL